MEESSMIYTYIYICRCVILQRPNFVNPSGGYPVDFRRIPAPPPYKIRLQLLAYLFFGSFEPQAASARLFIFFRYFLILVFKMLKHAAGVTVWMDLPVLGE